MPGPDADRQICQLGAPTAAASASALILSRWSLQSGRRAHVARRQLQPVRVLIKQPEKTASPAQPVLPTEWQILVERVADRPFDVPGHLRAHHRHILAMDGSGPDLAVQKKRWSGGARTGR